MGRGIGRGIFPLLITEGVFLDSIRVIMDIENEREEIDS